MMSTNGHNLKKPFVDGPKHIGFDISDITIGGIQVNVFITLAIIIEGNVVSTRNRF